jgi:hypothetical protein
VVLMITEDTVGFLISSFCIVVVVSILLEDSGSSMDHRVVTRRSVKSGSSHPS